MKNVAVITGKDYDAYNIFVYRQKAEKITMGAGDIRRETFPVEFMAKIGPIYVKDKSELHQFERQIAYANRDMLGYDWTFKAERIGHVNRRALEDVARPNNLTGYFCGECQKPTTKAGINFCRQHTHR